MIDVYEFDSGNVGPTVAIFGAIHGNETVGPQVLLPLVDALKSGKTKLKSGRLTVVPVCNPQAYEKNVRYIDINLNRLFGAQSGDGAYEFRLAQELMPLIAKSDYLLDVHSTHTSGDPAFVFAEEGFEGSLPFAKSLGVDKICLDWNVVFQDEDFSTEAFALKNGRLGLTLECGYHNDPDALNIANQGIYGALSYTGLLPSEEQATIKAIDYYRFKDVVLKVNGATFTKAWAHMDLVKKGDVVYTNEMGQDWVAQEDGCVLIPDPNAVCGDEMFYFGVRGN
jgi:predicted deacylase